MDSMNSVIFYGMSQHLVDRSWYGKACRDVIKGLLGTVPDHDKILINGIAVDIYEATHPIYDNAIIRIVPRLETKGAC